VTRNSSAQLSLLEPEPSLPEGFRYCSELLSEAEERALLAEIERLPFREFEFHGFSGRRRVVSFGWQYDFNDSKLRKAGSIPQFLLPVRDRAARFVGLDTQALEHVLVTEYSPGAAIGWHKDKAIFNEVIGISLLFVFARKPERIGCAPRSGSSRVRLISFAALCAPSGNTAFQGCRGYAIR